jgi:hypothetical protein
MGMTRFDWAGVLAAATNHVAELGAVGSGNEAELHRRLRTALSMAEIARVLDSEGRLQRQDRWWTRAPGGIDVVALRSSAQGERALGVECKVGKPGELLWDAIKLGQRCDENPWNGGLEAAAIVAESTNTVVQQRSIAWFDSSVNTIDPAHAIARWPEAWYGLMCGGRGIRPTSLPPALTVGPGGRVPHAGGGSALCWCLVSAVTVSDDSRVIVDEHGWPPDMVVPEHWRRQIDRAAEKAPNAPAIVPRVRRVLNVPPNRTMAELVSDDEARLWADVWDRNETVPTSFRLIDGDATRYDIRRAKNDTLACPDPPKALPAWCAPAVADVFNRWPDRM